MTKKVNRRMGIAGLVVGLALMCAPGASAASLLAPCSGQVMSQPFARFLDPFSYTLAPNGGVEDGQSGWSLNGATVVSGNEPFLASGSHSLRLTGGSSATTPPMCVGITHPTVRFFATNKGLALASLKVDALYTDAGGVLRTLPLGVATGILGWQPSLPMVALGDLVNPLLNNGSATLRIRFTPVLGGDWRVDDVYVDPYARG